MIRYVMSGLAAAIFASLLAPAADAGPRKGYQSGPQVKGYAERRGGYSYSYADSVNTYGDNRSIYGGASTYRDPALDKQTNAGPFDHGFFFDSGVSGPHGGDSPYMN
ncbi:MAG: hypothetical protein ACKVP4_03670 [Hyphomicrobium sp.]